ncbi:MAG: LLM class flavin-dependent oxidoreductase [Acidothermales bacterium]|nr:LLM class flavin-dependent oxidoreductase [Acidothermales bacterium]
MRYGFVLPYMDVHAVPRLAAAAEKAGWDAFFVWECLYGIDAWVSLGAAAMTTSRIRLGTMLTPPSRMRPWKLASETLTLDVLSEGRVQLAVGLGAPDTGVAEFGEVTDRRTRAELMDESLDIMTRLWTGKPFSYDGKHYHLRPNPFPLVPPRPVQQPRIPIWVVGLWDSRGSMARVAGYDGIVPVVREDGPRASPAVVTEIVDWARAERGADIPFDIVIEGETAGLETSAAADVVRPYADAGATWWIESMWDAGDGSAESRERIDRRIARGPPAVD